MFTERDLYILNVASGWRIERPSGAAIQRQIDNRDAAADLLIAAGYRFCGVIGRSEHWSNRP